MAHVAALVLAALHCADSVVVAPYSGAPFKVNDGLSSMPSHAADRANAEMSLYRHRSAGASSVVSAHACDMGDQADEKSCLGVQGRGCMWTRVETRDPLKPIQASHSYCLPCRLDDQAIPCWSVGAWVDSSQVTHCSMSCAHQESVSQPDYACSDESGFISQSQCFDRAARSGSKCMFIAYEDQKGERRSSCGPCQLQGSGGWGCPPVDGEGPVDGSRVLSCLSQCDVLCAGPPACPPTVAPPLPPPPPSPGVWRSSSPEHQMVSAPAPFVTPTANPYTIMQAARDAAEKAGYRTVTAAPLKVYWPVVVYRDPMANYYTTGPPPLLEEPPRRALLQSKNAQTTRVAVDKPARLPLLRQRGLTSM